MLKSVLRRCVRTAWNIASLRSCKIKRDKKRLDALATQGCRFLITIPYLKSGGAERVAANLAAAFSKLYGPDSVAILVTDWSGLYVRVAFPENVATSYPPGIRFVKIVNLSRAQPEERTWELMSAMLAMRPEMVINVNSELTWECWERFAPDMADRIRLGTVAFVHCGDKHAKPIGYTATHLERLLPFLDFVITDNKAVIEELSTRLVSAPRPERVPTQREWNAAKLIAVKPEELTRDTHDLANALGEPSRPEWRAAHWLAGKLTPHMLERDRAKFKCLYQSTPMSAPRPRLRPRGRPQILWASRVTRVKYPELLPRIARLLPDCDIHVWGAREIGYRWPIVKKLLWPQYDLGDGVDKAPNLHWHGAFKGFGALQPERYDCLLYTSLYDGLPNVLLEAGAHRIPVIAPPGVGGIGELIDADTGWPVANEFDAADYAARVRAVLNSYEEARRRSVALAHIIGTRHDASVFYDAVEALVEGGRTHAVRHLNGNGADRDAPMQH